MKHSRQFVPLHSKHRCSERSEEYSQRTQLHPADLRLPHRLLHGKKLYGVSGAAEREPPVQNSLEVHQEIFTQVHCQSIESHGSSFHYMKKMAEHLKWYCFRMG